MGGSPLRQILPFLKPYRKQFLLGPAAKLLEAVLELFMPIFMARLVDAGLVQGDTGVILQMGFWMLLTATVGLLSACVCQYSAAVAARGFGLTLREALFDRILRLSGRQLDEFGVQTLYSRLTADTTQLQAAVNMTIRLVIRAPFVCVGSVVATLLIDWRLGMIVVVALPLFAGVLYWIMRASSPLYRYVQQKLDALGARLREVLTGVRVVRAFANERYETEKFRAASDKLTDTTLRVGRLASLSSPLTSLIMNAAILAILWFGGVRIDAGALTTGELLAFISYVTQILTTLVVVANLVVLYTRSAASLKRVGEVLACRDEATEGDGPALLPQGDAALRFRGVTFCYRGARPSLAGISFTLALGGRLGVIGPTGAGKSTLAQLILRFYAPQAGSIELFGHPLGQYGARQLRQTVGLVAQTTELFRGTIAENIRMGNPDVTDADIEWAARIAQADGFIRATRDGYETLLSAGGTNLSGGQRQRLSIARALAARPKLLILDDASSALDYATDAAFRRALSESANDMALLIISQRVSAVEECDEILVLDDGALVANGDHATLYRESPFYRQIVDSQRGGGAQ